MELESDPTKGRMDEAKAVFGRTDHRHLKEAEAGAVVTELCRRHGMSSATFYAWKAKFGGMEVSDAKRLRALEEENARLKRLLADTMLDNAGLRDLLSKK